MRLTAVLLLLAILLLIGFIGFGWGDPKPLGELAQTLHPGTMTIPAKGEQVTWLETKPLGERFSVRLTAVFQRGERDIGYGLLLGGPHTTIAIKLSPLGYLTIGQAPATASKPSCFYCVLRIAYPATEYAIRNTPSTLHSPRPILPWQPWPHVRPDRNEIWLDVDGSQWAVRVNRERLWAGNVAERVERVGVVGEGFGGGETAVVEFVSLQSFQH